MLSFLLVDNLRRYAYQLNKLLYIVSYGAFIDCKIFIYLIFSYFLNHKFEKKFRRGDQIISINGKVFALVVFA